MFRFSLRDLLWLTVVVSLALALWLERRASPAVKFTGQPFDIAIDGEGYFQLTDPQTASLLFSRLGSLSVDSQSRVVLNVNGTEYEINPPMCIPSDASAVLISPTGRVAVQRRKAELVAVGQLQLATFPKPARLKQVAPAIYAQTTESGSNNQFLPGDKEVGTIIQGALTKSY
jgi:flagellar basal-body rod protein FlgG